jgi:rubrerythrin
MAIILNAYKTVTATVEFSEEELRYLKDLTQNNLVEKEAEDEKTLRESLYSTFTNAILAGG